MKIAYDAGHGINTPGKRSPYGEREWSFNNKVVLAFEKELKKYKDVELLRTDSKTGKSDIALKTRTDKANRFGSDIYISFHHNALNGKWGTHTGVETYHHKGSIKGKELAELIHKVVVNTYDLTDRKIKTSNLHITRETSMPSILIEGGFMDSTIDIVKLRDDKVLDNVGREVAKAIAKHFKLELKEAKKSNTAKEVDKVVCFNKGDKGASIKKLQQDLMKLGYSLGKFGADGTFGDATEKAVKSFQKDNKITVDGLAGAVTLSTIQSKLNKQNVTGFAVQVGYFEKKQNAQDEVDRLSKLGIKSIIKTVK